MTTIVGISGSLRRGSYNAALLRALAAAAPAGVQVEVAPLAGIPLYDGDVESAQGLPAPVVALKERIAKADGLLLVTPEYNQSLPGVMKNAIDWLSRPAADIVRVFGNRPTALAGATPGRGGTLSAQTAWLPVLRALSVRPWFGPRLMVGAADQAFDEQGALRDAKLQKQVADFIAGFVAFIASSRG